MYSAQSKVVESTFSYTVSYIFSGVAIRRSFDLFPLRDYVGVEIESYFTLVLMIQLTIGLIFHELILSIWPPLLILFSSFSSILSKLSAPALTTVPEKVLAKEKGIFGNQVVAALKINY
uniref:Uncharacterized protein n=1 Tax=Megaselia scalaris TaxID=36166 RepID=T1GZ13_MEGSC